MTPERWEQLKPLFHGALEQPPGERAAWLRRVCPEDEALRAEAEALLHAHETAGGFLEEPPAVEFPDHEHEDPIEPGQQLGPYLVRGELGRGGMGIVYLAEDVRLGRTVALKALPASFAGDTRRRERLRREARAAAALTHPGIATVYALEEIDGQLFIAAEHVKGRTLTSELARGPMDVGCALDTAIQIARALCAAHESGIVHRDLKPDNILRTDEGRIKLLDFGIAQFTDATLTQLTVAGAVMGTPAYMAPEQFVGSDVDFRADLYAVGVLLVEMITGAHPFATGSAERTAMPAELKKIADRCLARDPAERYASTRELLRDLERVVTPAPATSALSPRWWWEFHQAVAALIYWLMLIPVWAARGLIGRPFGSVMFVIGLAAVIVSANLRLHRWFTSRFYPAELPWVLSRTRAWVEVADWVFVAVLAIAGLLVSDARAALGILLLSVGIGTAVVVRFVEPGTARAAFGRETS